MAANWDKKFKSEYDKASAAVARPDDFAEDWKKLLKKLAKLMSADGFDSGEAGSLDDLRKKVSGKGVLEDEAILTASKVATDSLGGNLTADQIKRLAALKLLRHVYLLNKSGSKKVWVLSLPKAFEEWPSTHFTDKASSVIKARTLLLSDDEHFSEEQKKYLGVSTKQSLAWAQKAGAVLAEAGQALKKGAKASKGDTKSLAIVKRWFADPATTDNDLQGFVTSIAAGFKKIIATLNKGHFVVTDWVPFRASTDAEELDFLDAEAFTFRDRFEGMDTVYIEKNFFVDNPGNVLKGQKNWTRILLHELTHLSAGTVDVNKGNARYAWYGIGPHAGFTGADAATNADSWAFFAADCAGQLTDTERTTALKIV